MNQELVLAVCECPYHIQKLSQQNLQKLKITIRQPNTFQAFLKRKLRRLGYPGTCDILTADRFGQILNNLYGHRNYNTREFRQAFSVLIAEYQVFMNFIETQAFEDDDNDMSAIEEEEEEEEFELEDVEEEPDLR